MGDTLEKRIQSFIGESNATDLSLGDIAGATVAKAIESLGGSVDISDTFETNGWQMDWWVNGSLSGMGLMISGSGWYGGTTIEKVQE